MGNKIQRIYVGSNLVRPKWEYSYTFKGKTTTEIGNDFTVYAGTLGVNSDGVCSNSSGDVRICRDIPSLANAKKIIVDGTLVVNSQKVSENSIFIGISIGSGWGTGHTFNRIEGSAYSGCNASVRTNGTTVSGSSIGNATQGTYTQKLTIDLENKSVVGYVSGLGSSTITLTNAQITEIRTFTYLTVQVSKTYSALSDISIKIEY